ncbi:sulfate ABC transporter substrate-binding protein [filamentous cyanobacterium LEGE 11480]|uniref:Sulfate ABC transporter substrate-binding protein n=1 Tax=Romeriopsis navalis LEGE 11480 TaxID=2777977 RepID=A0A928Z6R0_9CYAN|nr:sulfate ABC transporter substrate-binding protein [Romeriopsis navalis]MBE9032465.1 sulfate ABC transporter substrate-binding protein [Romeriopsis navalis LEGE 11480]
MVLGLGQFSHWIRRWKQRLCFGLCGLSIALAITGCQGFGNADNTVEITLASFVSMKPAYQRIIPKFEAQWQQQHNQRVSINQSYSTSGSQTRALVDGLEADVAHLALALDMQKVAQEKLIEPGWEQEFPNGSIVAESVVALVTRAGNPKQINRWQDLTRSDIQVITADPRSSGVARWIFLALWNSVMQSGGSKAEADDFVRQLYQNVPVLSRDAREATSTFFRQGEGDILLNYENEIFLAAERGAELDYQIPGMNIAIETPVAIVDTNTDKHGNREVVTAFVQYLFSPEAQAEFAKVGFRPISGERDQTRFPTVTQLAQVEQLGGWQKLQADFFAEDALFDRIYQQK